MIKSIPISNRIFRPILLVERLPHFLPIHILISPSFVLAPPLYDFTDLFDFLLFTFTGYDDCIYQPLPACTMNLLCLNII